MAEEESSVEKGQTFQQMVLEQLNTHTQNSEPRERPCTFHRNELKMDQPKCKTQN